MALTNNFPNIGYTSIGRNYNFYQKLTLTWNTFGGGSVSGMQPDMLITFPTTGLMFLLEDGYGVSISYNGITIDDQMTAGTPSSGLSFDNRVGISKIYFALTIGSSATVSVRAWGNP